MGRCCKKKAILPTVKHNSEHSSKPKTGCKKPTKITHAQQKKKRRPKSKSSCVLETNRLEIWNASRGKPECAYENVLENIKKYKSLDHVTNVCSKNLSKISLRNKISKKLEYPRTDSVDSVGCKKLLNDILNNFSAAAKNSLNADGPGKSMSFEAIKLDGKRQISKSSSVENSKQKAFEKPIGVFNVYKKTYSRTPGPFIGKVNITETVSNDCRCRDQSSDTLESRVGIPKKNSSGSFQKFQASLQASEKQVFDNCNAKSERPKARSSSSDLNPKKDDSAWETSAERRTVTLCQCLHYHTENGIKRICLQNNSSTTKELGNKFFRVNYFSDRRDEGEEESEEKKELVDKETYTGNDVEKWLSLTDSNKKPGVEKKNSKKEKTTKKSPENLKKAEVEQEPNFVLCRDGSRMQILGPQSTSKNQESTCQKPKKLQKPRGDKKKSQKELLEVWADKSGNEESLKELRLLEKLSEKLSRVEKLKVKHKMLNHQKKNGKQLARGMEKIKTNRQGMGSNKSLLGLEAEGEYLRQKRKIRNSIIRQLKNWLKLELDET